MPLLPAHFGDQGSDVGIVFDDEDPVFAPARQ
jgi:hypothetical protein